MSENEIKPVAWVDLDVWISTNDAGDSFFTDYQDEDTVAVYDQSAIDRLTAERNAWAANALRLQFCVNHDSFPTLARNGKTWVLFMRTTANRRSSFFGATPTEAIDKAMAERQS